MFNHCPPKQLPKLESVTNTEGKRYYVSPNGVKLTSVTTVLSAKPKPHLHEWRKRVGEEEARRIVRVSSGRGTRLHSIAEDYLNNVKLRNTMPDALEMFLSVKPLLNRIDNIHYQEQSLWSESLGIAGTTDCIAEFDGKLSVIDFKNSRKIKKKEWIEDYFIQCTAYAKMYEECIGREIENVVIIMAVENESPLLFEESPKNYLQSLKSSIDYYKSNK